MIIWNFGMPEETAQALADNDLEKQIKAIAQTLCNVHFILPDKIDFDRKSHEELVPLKINAENYKKYFKWTQWASECRANYLKLVDMGLACCEEYTFRLSDGYQKDGEWFCNGKVRYHKLDNVMRWCKKNVPDLPHCLKHPHGSDCFLQECTEYIGFLEPTPFPLLMPLEYRIFSIEHALEINCEFTAESYRKYYRSKLMQKLEKCNSIFESENEISGGCKENNNLVEIKWTRRNKPSWVKL
jgi:hypothetical protein